MCMAYLNISNAPIVLSSGRSVDPGCLLDGPFCDITEMGEVQNALDRNKLAYVPGSDSIIAVTSVDNIVHMGNNHG